MSTPSLVLQCSEDAIAPREVGDYVQRHLPGSRLVELQATGHCPLPINAYPDSASRPQSHLSLKRGGTLLMYTDGLIEHRNRTDDGLARLLETVAENLDPQSFGGFTGRVAQALRDPAEADGVCLLATHLS